VMWRSQDFAAWRQTRTEFAFAPVNHPLWLILAFVALGAIAFHSRKWVALGFVGLVLCLVTGPALAWSGPGHLINGIMPLVDFRMAIWFSGWLLNGALLVLLGQIAWLRPNRSR
jgi:hypothetical protein